MPMNKTAVLAALALCALVGANRSGYCFDTSRGVRVCLSATQACFSNAREILPTTDCTPRPPRCSSDSECEGIN